VVTRSATAVPIWADANMPSPELLIKETEHLHFAPTTIERAIARLKAEQQQRLEEIETAYALPARPRPVRPRPALAPRPAQPRQEPSPAPAVRPSVDVLAGVHPLVRADVLKRSGGDLRRVRVLSATRVLVLNRPCGN
jgi:hypothetical protein